MHQAMICSFKVFQSSSFMKVLKIGIFGILAEWKMHYLANSTVTGMPYLPAKVELVSLNRFSSQGLWKWYNSRVFDQRLYAWRQHLMFCRFSRKRKFFGNWLWFSKMSHQRVFFLLNMKNFEISVLTANSLFLQTATLNFQGIRLLGGPCWVLLILYCIFPGSCWCLFIKALPNMIEAVVVFILQLIKFFLQAANLLPWEPSVSMSACSLGVLSTLLALHPASVLGYLPNYWLIKDYHCSWT